jgi:hypothetical protein
MVFFYGSRIYAGYHMQPPEAKYFRKGLDKK